MNKENEHRYYLSRIEREYDLINNLQLWMIYSQSIFLAASVIIYSSKELTTPRYILLYNYLPWLGLLSCVILFISILAAIFAIRYFVRQSKTPSIVGNIANHYFGLIAPLLLPMVFIITWLLLLQINNYFLYAIIICFFIGIVIGFRKTKIQ